MGTGAARDSVQLLREAGLRVTPQRVAVLVALESQSHPTADRIYRTVAAHFPGLGLATVYNTLTALQERGRVMVVEDRHGRRFDLRTEPHQHVRCRRCGAIEDLPHWNDITWQVDATPPGWAIEQWMLMAEGLCPACR